MRWLVSCCSGLGDTILKIPMFRALHELDSEAVVDVVTFPDREVDRLFCHSPWVNEVHMLSPGASVVEKARFFWALRRYGYEAIFLSYEAAHPYLIWGSYLAGIRCRVMHYGRTLNSFKNRVRQGLVPLLPGSLLSSLQAGRHKIDLNFDLLETYFGVGLKRDYSTPIHQGADGQSLRRFGLASKCYLVLQPGAARGMATPKTWAPHNFVELIRRVKGRWPGLAVVAVGDKGDTEVSCMLQREVPFIINTAGQTTLTELTDLLQNALLVVCHDSGIMHLANALEVDLIALYGPTDDTCTRPFGTKSRLLFSDNECRRLMYDWMLSEQEIVLRYPLHYCLSALSVDALYDEVTRVLSQQANRPKQGLEF